MKAMIFAAGAGTRLHPLTHQIPKALVEVGGRTMLEHTILHLKNYGVKNIVINIHHFPEMIEEFVRKNNAFGMDIAFSKEDRLLDTGGGLKKAAWFFDEQSPIILHNVDVLSNLDLSELYRTHLHNRPLATLAVRKRETSRYLLFDRDNRLCGWENTKKGEIKLIRNIEQPQRMAFSGIHIADPVLLQKMPNKEVHPITETYLELGKEQKIMAYREEQSYWFDIGNLENLEKARNFMDYR